MKVLADTGLLVGFLDASDQYHGWATRAFAEIHSALTTCEAVLAETEYLVPGSGPVLMEMAQRGTLEVIPLFPVEAGAVGTLMRKYPRMQLADACLVRLTELFPESVVYTTDKRDFAIYRRKGRELIATRTP